MNRSITSNDFESINAELIKQSIGQAILNIRYLERRLLASNPNDRLALQLAALRVELIRLANGAPLRIESILNMLRVRDRQAEAETKAAEVCCG